jgi:hypothetical protein
MATVTESLKLGPYIIRICFFLPSADTTQNFSEKGNGIKISKYDAIDYQIKGDEMDVECSVHGG